MDNRIPIVCTPENTQAKGGREQRLGRKPYDRGEDESNRSGKSNKRADTGGRVSTTILLQVAEGEQHPLLKRGALLTVVRGARCVGREV